jgi:hypothetical protein
MLATIKKIKTLFYIKTHERTYNKVLKYIFYRGSSDELVVIFSGFSPNGKSARYNYIKTLSNVDVGKLYILDNFGYSNRGTYYLSNGKDFTLMDEIVELIKSKSTKYKKITFVGSSKGGSSALIYGLKLNVDRIIVGAPQYFIGDYLDNEKHYKLLKSIFGKQPINKEFLNKIIKTAIVEYSPKDLKPEIFIHYSVNDKTYDNHISCLIEDLFSNNFNVNLDKEDYLEHSAVGIYFSKYMLSFFRQIKN